MGKLFAKFAAAVGTFIALTSSGMCWGVWFDEVEAPKSILK